MSTGEGRAPPRPLLGCAVGTDVDRGGMSSASSAKELCKDGITPRASERDIAGLKRAAQSLSRQRGRVGGVVQPPGAVIIVEVVVWVVGPDAYRGLVVFMNSHVVRG